MLTQSTYFTYTLFSLNSHLSQFCYLLTHTHTHTPPYPIGRVRYEFIYNFSESLLIGQESEASSEASCLNYISSSTVG